MDDKIEIVETAGYTQKKDGFVKWYEIDLETAKKYKFRKALKIQTIETKNGVRRETKSRVILFEWTDEQKEQKITVS